MSKTIISVFILASLVLPISFALAQDNTGTVQPVNNPKQLTNPLGVTDPSTLIGKVIKAALGIVGSLALLMFVYGGFMWMLSAGNEKMIEKGKSTLMWAALGLVVIFMSYALVNFVISTATSGG